MTVNYLTDAIFEWIQIKLMSPKILAWALIALGSTLIFRSSMKIRELVSNRIERIS